MLQDPPMVKKVTTDKEGNKVTSFKVKDDAGAMTDAERELKRMKTTEYEEMKAKLSNYRERQEQKIDAAVSAREKALGKQHFQRESDLIDKLGTAEARVQDVKVSYAILETERDGLKKEVAKLKRKLAAVRAGRDEEDELEESEETIDNDDIRDDDE